MELRRRHDMPFGAAVEADGHVRFGLWAPAVRAVDVQIEGTGGCERLPMTVRDDGWFVLRTRRAQAGDRYWYRIDGDNAVPDPASRDQADDVHGPSVVVDPSQRVWRDGVWRGRPWGEAVIYEVHVGTFTPEGTFDALRGRLDALVELGVTALELMPVADFPGARNWGYDGVLLFAPDRCYGTPDALKDLVEAAHARGLMVLMDVVYNHFGPEGNYLHAYAPQFFTSRHQTPWGDAINFDGPDSRWVREFFIHNALYWLEEFHIDGLRLDAVHAIMDDSRPDILEELAERVHAGPGREREVHLVLENDDNAARYLTRDAGGRPRAYVAQWNDDVHHALHCLLTGETGGYYQDYADAPIRHLARCLAEGFAYQGERSAYRHGRPRGEPSAHLPPIAFVGFLQNHDQVGNRAFGERIGALAAPEAVRAAAAVVLLAPAPPLLFMGEEWAAREPFQYFCDLEPDLAPQVTEGRREEFTGFPEFRDPDARQRIPDPLDPATFERSRLDWAAREGPEGTETLALYRELLALRGRLIAPALGGARVEEVEVLEAHGVVAGWRLGDGARLTLCANLGGSVLEGWRRPAGAVAFETARGVADGLAGGTMPPWGVVWLHAPAERRAR